MSINKVLLVGESWVSISNHYKGFNHFVSGSYETGIKYFEKAMKKSSIDWEHMPAHIAQNRFPFKLEELKEYSVIILSDVGADTFLLHPNTWIYGKRTPNRLTMLADFVKKGGGLIMIGGYLTFQGINAAGQYHRSPLARVLPVSLLPYDDRCEKPEGVEPIKIGEHPITKGLPDKWPAILGYNLLSAKSDAKVLASVENDPILVVGSHGKGKTVAWASDIGPHWCPVWFAEWEGYSTLLSRMIYWASGNLR